MIHRYSCTHLHKREQRESSNTMSSLVAICSTRVAVDRVIQPQPSDHNSDNNNDNNNNNNNNKRTPTAYLELVSAIVVISRETGRITNVLQAPYNTIKHLPPNCECIDVGDALIVPGMIHLDLINGVDASDAASKGITTLIHSSKKHQSNSKHTRTNIDMRYLLRACTPQSEGSEDDGLDACLGILATVQLDEGTVIDAARHAEGVLVSHTNKELVSHNSNSSFAHDRQRARQDKHSNDDLNINNAAATSLLVMSVTESDYGAADIRTPTTQYYYPSSARSSDTNTHLQSQDSTVQPINVTRRPVMRPPPICVPQRHLRTYGRRDNNRMTNINQSTLAHTLRNPLKLSEYGVHAQANHNDQSTNTRATASNRRRMSGNINYQNDQNGNQQQSGGVGTRFWSREGERIDVKRWRLDMDEQCVSPTSVSVSSNQSPPSSGDAGQQHQQQQRVQQEESGRRSSIRAAMDKMAARVKSEQSSAVACMYATTTSSDNSAEDDDKTEAGRIRGLVRRVATEFDSSDDDGNDDGEEEEEEQCLPNPPRLMSLRGDGRSGGGHVGGGGGGRRGRILESMQRNAEKQSAAASATATTHMRKRNASIQTGQFLQQQQQVDYCDEDYAQHHGASMRVCGEEDGTPGGASLGASQACFRSKGFSKTRSSPNLASNSLVSSDSVCKPMRDLWLNNNNNNNIHESNTTAVHPNPSRVASHGLCGSQQQQQQQQQKKKKKNSRDRHHHHVDKRLVAWLTSGSQSLGIVSPDEKKKNHTKNGSDESSSTSSDAPRHVPHFHTHIPGVVLHVPALAQLESAGMAGIWAVRNRDLGLTVHAHVLHIPSQEEKSTMSNTRTYDTVCDTVYFCSQSPAQALGLAHCKGTIAAGYDADLVVLQPRQSNSGDDGATVSVLLTMARGVTVFDQRSKLISSTTAATNADIAGQNHLRPNVQRPTPKLWTTAMRPCTGGASPELSIFS